MTFLSKTSTGDDMKQKIWDALCSGKEGGMTVRDIKNKTGLHHVKNTTISSRLSVWSRQSHVKVERPGDGGAARYWPVSMPKELAVLHREYKGPPRRTIMVSQPPATSSLEGLKRVPVSVSLLPWNAENA